MTELEIVSAIFVILLALNVIVWIACGVMAYKVNKAGLRMPQVGTSVARAIFEKRGLKTSTGA